jgi:hypothetical protein
MSIAEFTSLDDAEAVGVLRWRLRELARAGYALDDAVVLASRVEVDLHEACDLVARGCPSGTVIRILL